jgi:hypothetical protein
MLWRRDQGQRIDLHAIRAQFDGRTIKFPKEIRKMPPGVVLITVQGPPWDPMESASWPEAQEAAFAKVWDNDEDAGL